MIVRDSMDYVRAIENSYKTEEEITFGPMNNVQNYKKPKDKLFPIRITAIQPLDLFFWEMENRDAVRIPPILGLILSVLVGPFTAMIIIHTDAESSYRSTYYIVSRAALIIHCLMCPLVDILLLFQVTKRRQPLWPFITWLIVKLLTASLMAAHIYYIYAILNEVTPSGESSCYKFMRAESEYCDDSNLFHYQMDWFLPIYETMTAMKGFFLWMIFWYAVHCRHEKPKPPRTKYVEDIDWFFYKPNPVYGMGFSYWDNFDMPNPQGEIQEYYSDLISKGLKIQPPHQNDLYEMFNYATSSGSCPL